MQPSSLTLHRRLDELVLDALAAHQANQLQQLPSDSGVSIEVVTEAFDGEEDDVAVTNRFVRISAPYEAMHVEAIPSLAALRTRPTTFVRTVPARTAAQTSRDLPAAADTLSFDKVWFEQPDDAIAAIEETPVDVRRSWWWLVASLAAAGAAVTAMALYA